MPIYTIGAPDGRDYEVEAPEGARKEDLFAFVQQQMDQEAQAAEDALRDEKAALYRQSQIEEPGFLENIGIGYGDDSTGVLEHMGGISIWQLVILLIIGAIIWTFLRRGKKKGGVPATSVDQRNRGKNTDDASLYEKYTAEFESGDTDKAVMAKAMAIHGGDREKAKYEYVRLKVAGEKVADTSLENGNEGGQELSHTESFFNGGQGWLVALSPCVIGAVIFSISQGGADQTFSFLFGQIIGSTLASALPGLLIGGLYILIKRPDIGGDVILKKCIFWSAVAMTAFVVIGIQAN